jgi:DNA (cytosine-5)-methyltransferase 1
MKHGSLFNGIGGFQLAAEWMWWENIMSCEIDSFCNTVTKFHYPKCQQHYDIRTTDFTIYRGLIDILTGGFPCQPYSLAGKRKGKEDDRHLWPEMLRAIREIQPRWIVGENVFGIVNWSGGMVFDEVQTSLEAEGYEVQPFILPACGVNAPHRRDRVWFVAQSGSNGHELRGFGNDKRAKEESEGQRLQRERLWHDDRRNGEQEFITDSEAIGMEGGRSYRKQKPETHAEQGLFMCGDARTNWSEWPTQPPLYSRNDGLSFELAGITFSKWRNESIKSLGNAIVPQVAYQIFKAIEEYESL